VEKKKSKMARNAIKYMYPQYEEGRMEDVEEGTVVF